MKWNISKCPVFTSRKVHQQILVSFPRQVVNTIFIHGVTTFDKGTLGPMTLLTRKNVVQKWAEKNPGKSFLFGLIWYPRHEKLNISPIQGGKRTFPLSRHVSSQGKSRGVLV